MKKNQPPPPDIITPSLTFLVNPTGKEILVTEKISIFKTPLKISQLP